MTFCLGYMFFAITLVYYGLTFNAAQLPGDLYVNNTINGAVEILSYGLCILALDPIGRKKFLSGTMITGGICCIGSMLMIEFGSDNSTLYESSKWLSFSGKFLISAAFCAVYIFSAELFPTDVRSIGVGCGSMFGRVGGFAAPLIIELQFMDGLTWVPMTIFGVSTIIGGVICLFLPETAKMPIFRTIEDAENFHNGKNLENTDPDSADL